MSNEPDFDVGAPEVDRPLTTEYTFKSRPTPLPLHLLFAVLMGVFFVFGIKGLAAQSELDTYTAQTVELVLESKRLEEELERTKVLLRVTEVYADELATELKLTQGICVSIADRINTIADNI